MDKQPEVLEKGLAQKVIFFFLEKKDLLFWIFSGILLCALVIFQVISFMQRAERKAKVEFETTYESWLKDKNSDTFAKLQTLLQKHASIATQYEGLVIQKGLEAGNLSVLPLAKKSSGKGNGSPYSEFGQISLLIMEKNLTAAVERSYALKSEVMKKKDMETLTAFTLFRIATLEKALAQKDKEKKAWEEMEKFIALNKEKPEVIYFLENFRKGQDVSLAEYIAYRKALLQ
jgi:hypothetical protein